MMRRLNVVGMLGLNLVLQLQSIVGFIVGEMLGVVIVHFSLFGMITIGDSEINETIYSIFKICFTASDFYLGGGEEFITEISEDGRKFTVEPSK
jgi:hypothetical protein